MGILKNNILENFPYLEDDFDALTDYELFCKLIGIKVDYEMLPDKPKINGVELVGDSSLDKLDIERKITSSNKLNADLVSDTSSTNKFVTATDKTTWNAKQNAITSSNKLASDLVTDDNQTNKFVTSTDISNWNGKQSAITSDSKLSADLVSDSDTTNKFVTSTDITSWNNKLSVEESGTNANGSYIKYSDGTLVCYAKKSINVSFHSSQKWGVLWESDGTSLGAFPYTFYDVPIVNVTNTSTAGGLIELVQSTSTTDVGTIYMCRPVDTNSSQPYVFSIVAIGRWKA